MILPVLFRGTISRLTTLGVTDVSLIQLRYFFSITNDGLFNAERLFGNTTISGSEFKGYL